MTISKASHRGKKSFPSMGPNELSQYFAGHLLVAMPHMQDPRFKEAIIFMCGHDEQGAMGIVINKLIEAVSLEDLLEQLGLDPELPGHELRVHYGGPVELGRGFVLHTSDYLGENSVEITSEVALSASTNVLQDVVDGHGPDHLLLALGYAGWSSGQLESEIMENGWLLLPAEASILFDPDPESLWRRTLQKFGVDPDHLSTESGHA